MPACSLIPGLNSQVSKACPISIVLTTQVGALISAPARPTTCSVIGTRGPWRLFSVLIQYRFPSSASPRKEPDPPASTLPCSSGVTSLISGVDGRPWTSPAQSVRSTTVSTLGHHTTLV